MSDHTPENQDTPPEASQNDAIDSSRRKLTGAALGVSAVFTLASRPVWANQCTISGMMSGNLSAPKGPPCQGCTPGFWSKCQKLSFWDATGFKTTDKFNTVFGVTQYTNPLNNKPYTLLQVLGLQGQSCAQDATQPNCSTDPSGLAIGKTGCDPVSVNLGFHAVAALLSAAHPGVNYGYTSGEIINLFRSNYLTNGAQLKDTLDQLNNRGCPL